MKQPMKLNPAEYSTVMWYWTVPAGQSVDEITEPAYWQHVVAQLRPGHEIKVVSEDRTFWAHLLVRSVGRAEATVAVIQSVVFDAAADEDDDDMDTFIRWRNPALKFGVFRKSDKECLQDGFATKAEAYAWAAQKEAA